MKALALDVPYTHENDGSLRVHGVGRRMSNPGRRATPSGDGGRLAGKVAIVTGSGSGIGRATARLFASEGAAVAALDLDAASAHETCVDLDTPALAIELDVTDAEAMCDAVRRVTAELGNLNIFFANAGVPQSAKPFAEITPDEWDRIFAVNVSGVFRGIQAAAPAMRVSGSGSIVVTSSIAAARPRPGIAAYVASKAAVNGLVRALALELAPDRIRVNAIAPVAVRTPMLRKFGFSESEDDLFTQVAETIPLGRLTEPEDVAAAALYLASEDARCVTGIVLNVDGGRDL